MIPQFLVTLWLGDLVVYTAHSELLSVETGKRYKLKVDRGPLAGHFLHVDQSNKRDESSYWLLTTANRSRATSWKLDKCAHDDTFLLRVADGALAGAGIVGVNNSRNIRWKVADHSAWAFAGKNVAEPFKMLRGSEGYKITWCENVGAPTGCDGWALGVHPIELTRGSNILVSSGYDSAAEWSLEVEQMPESFLPAGRPTDAALPVGTPGPGPEMSSTASSHRSLHAAKATVSPSVFLLWCW
eukprot:TRINITY_DN8789_c0_g1_i2.p1 TRINITY_DN8789_c0_g1~~TRINITY_DN8789_c0_g1_i2.p1  ORF type:complete len:242 (-),score=32.41 TRINITY_DN8789_c0_g1_i2:56-781(-)